MTPKRKSTLSQNSFRSKASSYFTPLHVLFHDEKARQDFSKNFSKYGIHSECHVIFSDFSNTDLPTIINSRGWESFCEIPVSCPSVIIHEFYSNMHGFDYSIPCFITFVQGIRIAVTSQLISDVLLTSRVSHLDYPNYPRLKTMSKEKLLSLFCETPSLGVIVKTPLARALQKVRDS